MSGPNSPTFGDSMLSWLKLLPVLALLLAAGIFALGIATADDVRGVFFNSDLLLPAAYVHDLFHYPQAAPWFQLPRIPSLVPDLATILLLSAAIPSWRVVSLCYAVLSFTALMVVCGLIAAKLAKRTLAASLAMFLAITTLAMLLDLQLNNARGAFFYILSPVIHSGSLVAALLGVLLVKRFIDRPTTILGIAVVLLTVSCTVSDRIFIGVFAIPAVVGTLTLLLPSRHELGGTVERSRVLLVLGLVVLGCAGGFVLDQLLFTFVLVRGPDLPINVQLQVSRLPAMIRDTGLQLALAGAVFVVLLPTAWLLRSRDGRFWWAVAATTVAGTLALLPLVFINQTATRYAQPIWWWVLIVLAAASLRAAPKSTPLYVAGAAAVLVLVTARGRADLFAPALVTQWRDPVERCLAKLHSNGEVHAGLAEYWVARSLEASSDWKLQIVQITEKGWAKHWLNNGSYYARLRDDPGQPPEFDFLVASRLDLDAIKARYGAPARVVPCADTEVWIYGDPRRLQRGIVGADSWASRDGLLATPAWFSPADLYVHTGPLPPDGMVPAINSPTPTVASFGPYLAMSPGAWRMALHYQLTGHDTSSARWEINIGPRGRIVAQGALETGERQTKAIAFDVPADLGLMEFRTFLTTGDRLQLLGFSLCPSATPEASCRPEALGQAPDAEQQ